MYETKPYAYFKFEMLTNHLKENYLSIFLHEMKIYNC